MRSVELFAGAGGMALGVAAAGFEPSSIIERDEIACATLRRNRPDWPVIERDLRDIGGEELARFAGVDLLAGGPPCQPFTTDGGRKSSTDPRDMFPDTLRAVRLVRPRALLLENVTGLIKGKVRPYFDSILENLRALNYDVAWRLLNAADYGVPQRRERVFIVAFRRDVGARWTWPEATHSQVALLHAQLTTGDYWREHGLPEPGAAAVPFAMVERFERSWPAASAPRARWRTARDAVDGLPGVCPPPAVPLLCRNRFRRVHVWDHPARTVTTSAIAAMVGVADGNPRHLTPRELARLQTFPDDWTFVGDEADQMRQIGNAVPVDLAAVLARQIAACLSEAVRRAA